MQEWAKEFYGSKRWHRCRTGYLKSKNYLCERCLTAGLIETAKVVHHKIYLNQHNINNPEVALNWAMLEALCQDCHNREHHGRKSRRYSFDEDGNIIK